MYWRTGRKLGRTIYAQLGPGPSDNDILIGMMDTKALAEDAVAQHNQILTPEPAVDLSVWEPDSVRDYGAHK